MDFLPDSYEPPKSNSAYLRLQDGDNKLRILSRPIIGWEDWNDNHPIRYRMADKPSAPIDEKRPIKHFWAMIVWDYQEARIKIWHVTQASILRSLSQLVQDPDWGSPFAYDIKINKSGKDMRTKYAVNPSPHKPIANEIKEAFEAKPINLDALFDNADPFAVTGTKTPGCFDATPKPSASVISKAQVKELLEYIGDDAEYLGKLNENLAKHFGCKSLNELPSSKYEALLKSVKLHAQERLKKEMETKVDDSLPF